MSGPLQGSGPASEAGPDPLWDDERLVLLVIASGMVVMSASATLQVLWLVTLLLAPVVPRWLVAPPRGSDGGEGGGGGGGLRGRGGPRPTRPSGVK